LNEAPESRRTRSQSANREVRVYISASRVSGDLPSIDAVGLQPAASALRIAAGSWVSKAPRSSLWEDMAIFL
jgi:hypothetical protein